MLKFASKMPIYLLYAVVVCFAVNFPMSAQTPKKTPPQTIKSLPETAEKLFDDAQKLFESETAPNMQAAIPKLRQAAEIFRGQNKIKQAADCDNLSGRAYSTLGDQKTAIGFYTKSLKIYEQMQDWSSVSLVLNNIGFSWLSAGDYAQSLESYSRGLETAEKIIDKSEKLARRSLISYNTGYTYASAGNKDEAANYYKQALAAARENSDSAFEYQTLNALGTLCLNFGDRRQAVEYLDKARLMPPELSTAEDKYTTLNNLALAYDGLGEKQTALDYYRQSLEILKTSSNPAFESVTVNNIGLVYLLLGNAKEARDNFEKALAITEKTGDKATRAKILNNLAYLYDEAGEYEKAAEYYGKSVELAKTTNDLPLLVKILNNLSVIFIKLNEPNESLKTLNTAFLLIERLKDREIEATVFNNFAQTYVLLGNHSETLRYYTQSLGIARTNGYKSLEATTLTNLMSEWNTQKNPNLAVFYGKQAVNLYQQLRTNIKNFDDDSCKSYLQSVSGVYRKLADILIGLGRLPEAEQILGMLKQEEYSEFVRRDGGEAKKLLGDVELSPAESEAVARCEKISGEITTKGAEYEKLLKLHPAAPEEQAVLDKKKAELKADLTAAAETFNLFLKHLETQFAKSKTTDITATINENRGLQSDLKRWKMTNTVFLSTVVGEDNYSVILTTPTVQVPGQTPIKSAELNKMVHDFREAVQNPCACIDPRPLGEKLYNILLKPVAPQLAELEKQAGGKPLTLVWSLDGTLRYLPISALWDGKQYLAEKYLNAEFSLASRTRLGENPTADWRGLGVGVTQAHGDFAALPAVKDELINGAIHDEKTPTSKGIVPGKVFLDTQFTENTFAQELSGGEYPLVHIASHFLFKPGNDKQSYLLLGDGGELSLDKIRTSPDFKFNGVELLTLSACNTATGNAGTDGKEFESFAVLAQQNGALAVLATLWSVADESTQTLMSEFYRQHQDNHLSKAEALRAAQLALLNGTLKANSTQPRRSDLAGETNGNLANLPPFVKMQTNRLHIRFTGRHLC